MKVVQINETCGTKSIGRIVSDLAYALKVNGDECLVLYSSGDSNYKDSIMIGNKLDHKIHALFSRIFGLQGYYSYFSTKKMIDKLKEYKPDIVHLHNLHANYINLSILFSYLFDNDITTVVTLHDCWMYTGKCFYYVGADCNKWEDCCDNCPQIRTNNVNKTYFFDKSKRSFLDKKQWIQRLNNVGIVGVSQWVTDEASKSFLSKFHPKLIYNWVDLDVFKPRKSELRSKMKCEEKFVIIFVSAYINEIKGYDIIVGLSKDIPKDWKIIVIGQEVKPLPLNVVHISHTNDPIQLSEYYSMADVCINTTKYETFGLVTAEAISCGTPVIVFNNTASLELVDEQCGIIVDENEGLKGVKKAILEIHHRGKAAYSDSCVKVAKTKFNKEYGTKRYIDLYSKLLKNKSLTSCGK